MTKKELSKYYYLTLEIKNLEDRIEVLESSMLGSSTLSHMPKSKSTEVKMEKMIEMILELEEKIIKRKVECINEIERIVDFINKIPDPETRLIYSKRYIELKSWQKISEEMYMGIATVFRKHKKYLK